MNGTQKYCLDSGFSALAGNTVADCNNFKTTLDPSDLAWTNLIDEVNGVGGAAFDYSASLTPLIWSNCLAMSTRDNVMDTGPCGELFATTSYDGTSSDRAN